MSNKPLLIGIGGRAEHGKNAATSIIKEYVERIGGTCQIFEISQLILAECIERGDLAPGTLRDGKDKIQNKFLVDHGNRRRAESPTYWTKQIHATMLASGATVAICPNIRFPQEALNIQKDGGTIWRIVRLNTDGSMFISDTRDPNDVCETTFEKFPADICLYNMEGKGKLLERLVLAAFKFVTEDNQ